MCESIVEWVSWSEGVKWKKRGPVVDENWSIVECRNLEIAESDFVEYFEELRCKKEKVFGRSSELQVAGVHEKLLCRTKYAWCSRTRENVKVEGDGVKGGKWG